MKQNYDFIPVPISIRDRNGRYVYINKAWREMFSYEDAETIGKTDADLSLDPLTLPNDEMVGPVGACAFRDVYVTTKQKGRLLLELIETVIGEGTENESIVCVHQDVTGIGWRMEDLTRNLSRSEQSFRQEYQRAMDFTRELSEPLAHIGRCCEMISGFDLTRQQREWLTLLRDNAQLLQHHIRRNIDLHSKPWSDDASEGKDSVEVSRLLDEIRELYSSIAMERGVNLELHVSEQLLHPMALDSRHVQRILVNMVDAAVRGSKGGRVKISAALVPDSEQPFCIKAVVEKPAENVEAQGLVSRPSIRTAKALCGFIGGRLETGVSSDGSNVISVYLPIGSDTEGSTDN